MNVTLALKTMAAIDLVITADQGASFRQNLQKVLPHMGDAYRGKDDNPFRTHLGASIIGHECARQIWYGFRWSSIPTFPARIIRLFNRGHLEEARFISQLLAIGVTVYQQDEHGKQFRISDVGGHFGGSGDGVAMGVPDIPPDQGCLLEFKTHNDKSFKKLKASGVREAKFEHFVQMQTYMRKMGLMFALYGAVNKNDDECYWEIIVLDTIIADQFIQRGREIILMRQEPKRISESPGWFACSWCDYKGICHKNQLPARNCRTCIHSDACEDGNWYCNLPTQPDGGGLGTVLTPDAQLKGCDQYVPFSGS